MKNLTSNIIPASFIAATIAVSGILAPMASAQDKVTFNFDYSAEELSTQSGMDSVLERLEIDAKRACSTSQRLTIQAQKTKNACVQTVMNNALKTISAPKLMAQYEATQNS